MRPGCAPQRAESSRSSTLSYSHIFQGRRGTMRGSPGPSTKQRGMADDCADCGLSSRLSGTSTGQASGHCQPPVRSMACSMGSAQGQDGPMSTKSGTQLWFSSGHPGGRLPLSLSIPLPASLLVIRHCSPVEALFSFGALSFARSDSVCRFEALRLCSSSVVASFSREQ